MQASVASRLPLSFNQVVQGSSPCQPTNNNRYLEADKILESLVIVPVGAN